MIRIVVAAHNDRSVVPGAHQWVALLICGSTDQGIKDHEGTKIEAIPCTRLSLARRVHGIVERHEVRRLPEVLLCEVLGVAAGEKC